MSDHHQTPLAASLAHPAVVWTLLRSGADPERASERPQRLIEDAARHGDPDTLRLLLQAGAPIAGALVHARDPALFEHLVEAGADPDSVDASGETPLGRAASRGDLARVRRLLDIGAGVDLPDEELRTPLMRAAGRTLGHPWLLPDAPDPTVQALLEAGARTDTADALGRTAAEHARRAGRHALADRLESR